MDEQEKAKDRLPAKTPERMGAPDGDDHGHTPFPVVGIGASAGGLEAVSQLLSTLPGDTGMAFLVVQHLDPHHESRLPELLARKTKMPVQEAVSGLRVEPDHVYVIPPNARLALARGVLHLSPRPEMRGPQLPIDYLFRSLAVDQQARAVAVVLSGTGSDGTQGVCEVKAVGGITFAQDEESAAHPGMPGSAVESGCIDFVLSPEEIGRRLAEIGEHPYLADGRDDSPEETADASYGKILAAVRAATGVDFRQYRNTTIRRRIMRRMALGTEESLAEYAKRVTVDTVEAHALYHDLLINVTSFFRDPEMFEALKTSVFPSLAKDKSPSDAVRVWVPGCSTGQEAYSLAMALVEFYDHASVRPPIQIFATDLTDQNVLDKARAGLYPEGIEAEVSPERLRRFFRREDHLYRIDKSIRDVCIFARQNVTADPPFSHMDLISCRNVLIYLTTPLQKRILPMFHYALSAGGYLVLGTAETVGEHTDLFELIDRGHRIYSKKPGTARPQPFFSSPDFKTGVQNSSRVMAPPAPTAHDFQKEADRILLGRYAPPGVLVDQNLEILQYRGKTSAYLEPPSGEPTTNVLKMAREGLFVELRNALAEAKKQGQPVRREGIRLRVNGTTRTLGLEVVPVHPPGGSACFLVLFQEPPAESPPAPGPPEPLPSSEADAARELVQLRQELAATREYLQSLVEQQDAANEELRSANEEILSSNEELQSTNEELETAKEELQSANEELTTVNEQLHRRNQELDQANNDLTNLLSSANIPVIMVGGDLRIRRFTPPARRVMSLLPTDVGRPISDIKPTISLPELETLILGVIDDVRPVEREVRDADGRWFVLRIHPYRTADNRIDGAVLVLVDVDELRRSEKDLRQRLALIELSQDAIVIRDAEDRIVAWNRGAQDMYGWAPDDARGKKLNELLQVDDATWNGLSAQLAQNSVWEGELRQVRRDGSPLTIHSREVLVRDESGKTFNVLSIQRDMTELRAMMHALREGDRRKNEFLALLAHELRNPLAPVRNAVEIMRRSSDDPQAVLQAREMLGRQVAQFGRIVDDLIDLTRIVEQKIDLRIERVALATVVDTALETCRSQIHGRGQTLTVELPEKPLHVDADPARLAQVFVNLLSNASKYSEHGGKLSLTAQRATSRRLGRAGTSAGEIIVRVRDDGIGIEPEFLPRIFDMFSQHRGPQSRAHGGLGVGLTLVRSLVQMHGGLVEAQSEGPGHGSEFIVRLPLADAPDRMPVARPEAPPAPSATSRPRRILVVDDNEDQAQSLAMLLQLMGHEVQVAYAGPEALEMVAVFEPEVALIDIGLPGMSGYELAGRLRAHELGPKMLLVAQTGWGSEEHRRRSEEAGFDHHLVKPVLLETLEPILREDREQ